MAILKTTYVSGGLYVTGSQNFVSASQFIGTASWATHSLDAVTASYAQHVDPEMDLEVRTLHVTNDAQVDGNLKVLGDLTYVGVQDLRVKDHQIELNVDVSGSAQGSANGSGIVMKGTDTDIELIYSSSDDKLHVNKAIAGTIDSASEAAHAVSASRADSAASADAVANALSFGTGISKSVASYNGSEAVEIALDENAVKNIKVNSASRADSAASADAVANKLHIKVQHSGSAAVESDFDGSSVVSASVDFTGVETTLVSHSASLVDLQEQIDEISGGGTGSIDTKIQNAINELDADADASATGTPVSGGVFVLSGVAFNETDGKLTSGSATSVEVEKAGAAAKAVASLSSSVASDISGIRSDFESYTASADDRLAALETASGSAITRLNALESATSSYVTNNTFSSYTSSANDRLDALETASAAHVTNTTFNNYTSSANDRLNALEEATASLGESYLTTASFQAYTQSQANVDASQSARLVKLEDSASAAVGRLNALEAATASYADSASVATAISASDAARVALSSSIAATDLAQSNKISALETASGSAITRLNALEAATASYADSASVATVTSASEARIAELEASASAVADDYVKKAGDTMSGDLNMSTANAIIFGDMKIVWNATDQAIEFVSAA